MWTTAGIRFSNNCCNGSWCCSLAIFPLNTRNWFQIRLSQNRVWSVYIKPMAFEIDTVENKCIVVLILLIDTLLITRVHIGLTRPLCYRLCHVSMWFFMERIWIPEEKTSTKRPYLYVYCINQFTNNPSRRSIAMNLWFYDYAASWDVSVLGFAFKTLELACWHGSTFNQAYIINYDNLHCGYFLVSLCSSQIPVWSSQILHTKIWCAPELEPLQRIRFSCHIKRFSISIRNIDGYMVMEMCQRQM